MRATSTPVEVDDRVDPREPPRAEPGPVVVVADESVRKVLEPELLGHSLEITVDYRGVFQRLRACPERERRKE